jgi:peptide/nickel transport system permease protein
MAVTRTTLPETDKPPDLAATIKLPKQESLWAKALKRFVKHRAAMVGLMVLLIIVLLCVFAGLITRFDPDKPDILLGAVEPGGEYFFGTDELGRDVFTRVLYGGQISLVVGTMAVVVSVLIGTLIGAFAGFFGGWVDNILMRFTDFALCFPSLFLLILLVSVFGSNFLIIILVIGGLNWMGTARLVRSSFLSIKEKDFVEAARSVGAKSGRIMWRHILPNATGPLIVTATLGMAGGIISETSLSFLGLGIQPPTPSWGNMLKDAQDVFTTAPWLAIFPGLMIFLTVLSINFIGDGLRDALDPKGKL